MRNISFSSDDLRNRENVEGEDSNSSNDSIKPVGKRRRNILCESDDSDTDVPGI